jgi:4-carboxymuconolactone decarboxylase
VTDEERMQRADETRKRLLGDAPTSGLVAGFALGSETQAIAERFAFGDIWSRDGLPLKTRSLITIGILTALYRPDGLRTHIHGALNIGVTPDEIIEAIVHASVYGGLPTGASGKAIAGEVFQKRGLHGAHNQEHKNDK